MDIVVFLIRVLVYGVLTYLTVRAVMSSEWDQATFWLVANYGYLWDQRQR